MRLPIEKKHAPSRVKSVEKKNNTESSFGKFTGDSLLIFQCKNWGYPWNEEAWNEQQKLIPTLCAMKLWKSSQWHAVGAKDIHSSKSSRTNTVEGWSLRAITYNHIMPGPPCPWAAHHSSKPLHVYTPPPKYPLLATTRSLGYTGLFGLTKVAIAIYTEEAYRVNPQSSKTGFDWHFLFMFTLRSN